MLRNALDHIMGTNIAPTACVHMVSLIYLQNRQSRRLTGPLPAG